MKRLIVMIAILALVGCCAPSAKAAPHVESVKKTRTRIAYRSITTKATTTSPIAITGTKPRLVAATAKRQRQFNRQVTKFIAAQVSTMKAKDTTMTVVTPGNLRIASKASLYRGRYASVTMTMFWTTAQLTTYESSPRTFTLDLVTGRTVKLSRFARITGKALQKAVIRALSQQDSCAWKTLRLTKSATATTTGHVLPKLTAWRVSSKGVTFSFGRGAVGPPGCFTIKATVAWKYIPAP